jgi:antitoxin PrlF
MRITSKGQVTIPAAFRERFGLMPETDVEFVPEGNVLTLRKAAKGKRGRKTRGERAIRLLQEVGAKSRTRITTDEIMKLTRGERLVRHLEGKGDVPLTTDEIMAMTRGE